VAQEALRNATRGLQAVLVVAREIRLLAERSTKSTKRIEALVKSIQGDTYEAVVAMEDSTQEVVKGSQLVGEAGHALNTIYRAVERQAKMIENIAVAANERRSLSEVVAVAMGQISEITRQMDAGTQEAAASASYLVELAEQLGSSVSTFRLPDHMDEIAGAFAYCANNPLAAPAHRTFLVNEASPPDKGRTGGLAAGGTLEKFMWQNGLEHHLLSDTLSIGDTPNLGNGSTLSQ
jgi:hypothetical protein